jgi:hypothetical protein
LGKNQSCLVPPLDAAATAQRAVSTTVKTYLGKPGEHRSCSQKKRDGPETGPSLYHNLNLTLS